MKQLIKDWIFPFLLLILRGKRVQQNRLSLSRTLYFNFKALPFKQATKLPIFIYHHTSIYNIGKIEIKDPKIFPGMIQWGKLGYKSSGNGKISNYGEIIFYGPVFFWGGCIIENLGTMLFRGDTQVGEGSLMLIRSKLDIGRYTRIGFLSFFMDSDDHYTINTETMKIANNKAPIKIGEYNWIANKAVVKKGTVTPPYTIVASSNTLLSKDYGDIGPYCVLGGIPAKVIGKGIRRIYNYKAELELNNYFKEHPNEKSIVIDIKPADINNYCLDNALHF